QPRKAASASGLSRPWVSEMMPMELTSRSGASLHVGDPRRHAEFAAANFGERRDALADRLLRRVGVTQPQPAFAVRLVGRPLGTRIERDAGGLRGLRELLSVDHVG